MSDAMKSLASAGLDQAIDAVDISSKAAIEVVQQTRGAVADVAGAVVGGSDKVTEAAIAEIQELRGKLIERLRAVKESVVAPLEVLP